MLLLLLTACDVDSAPDPAATEEIVFEVPKGAAAKGLGDELAEAGLVRSEGQWGWFLRLGADGSCLKAGKHRVKRSMTATELLAALCGAPVPDDVPFTVVEGWRIKEIDEALVAAKLIEPGAYRAEVEKPATFTAAFPLPADTLEGYLFPETYMIVPDRFDVHAFVQRQLDTFGERFWKEHGAGLARPLGDVVKMASMIEREEPTPANRPLVAGILWKRLDNGWKLGVDATSRYTLADWNDREAFLKKLFDPTDPYNTRLRDGLPVTPIGNPGQSALEAAADPTDSEYWYYLHDSTKTLHPSRTVAEHEAYRRTYNVY